MVFIESLQKYATFTGKATRREFWMFTAWCIIIRMIIGIIEKAFGVYGEYGWWVTNLFNLTMFIPSLAVGWRRMHDVNKNGWCSMIPFYNLYFACQPSDLTSEY